MCTCPPSQRWVGLSAAGTVQVLADSVAAFRHVGEAVDAFCVGRRLADLRARRQLQQPHDNAGERRITAARPVTRQIVVLVAGDVGADVDLLEDVEEDVRQVACLRHMDVLPWRPLGDHLEQLHVEVRPACSLRADADRVDRVGRSVQGWYGGDGVVTARGNVRGIRPRVSPVPAVGQQDDDLRGIRTAEGV